ASAFAMTSKTECFPMVLLEAQASGVPVVSYACPHGPEHIVENDRNGFLSEPENKQQFAKKLSKLMHDDQLRAKFARNSASDVARFDREPVMRKWNELFQSLQKTNQ
ncbi:MAG: glycosyltransferase, partial [Chitinophagaceae bacterium]